MLEMESGHIPTTKISPNFTLVYPFSPFLMFRPFTSLLFVTWVARCSVTICKALPNSPSTLIMTRQMCV